MKDKFGVNYSELKPIESEREKYTEDEYEDMLRGIYGDVEICCMTYDAASCWREIDPVAFRLSLIHI